MLAKVFFPPNIQELCEVVVAKIFSRYWNHIDFAAPNKISYFFPLCSSGVYYPQQEVRQSYLGGPDGRV